MVRTPDARKLVAVVGGGPAGLGAAMEASRAGLATVVLDEDERLGGQYFRGASGLTSTGAPGWYRPDVASIDHRLGTSVVDARDRTSLMTWSERAGLAELRTDAVILATGAHDRPAPVPGWTLPGVFTAGGALTLAKAHSVAPGRRVVVAGSGPFILEVAGSLLRLGSAVTLLEATPWRAAAVGSWRLLGDAPALRQTIGLIADMARHGFPVRFGASVTRIGGTDRVEWADVSPVDARWRPDRGRSRRIATDSVVLGFGFVPRTELASLIGCRVVVDETSIVWRVAVDEGLRTSVPGVYAAGEIAGLSGARLAVLQGRLAGATAAFDLGLMSPATYERRVRDLRGRSRAARRTAGWLARTFAPQPGLVESIGPDDLVCRCEEVTRSRVDEALATMTSSPARLRAVKAATRCGMGRCQGQMCSTTLLALAARAHFVVEGPAWTARPPLRPVPLGALGGWTLGPSAGEVDAVRSHRDGPVEDLAAVVPPRGAP